MILTADSIGLAFAILRNSKVADGDVDTHCDVLKVIRSKTDDTPEKKFTDGELALEKAGWRYLKKQIEATGAQGWPGAWVELVPVLKKAVDGALALLEAAK